MSKQWSSPIGERGNGKPKPGPPCREARTIQNKKKKEERGKKKRPSKGRKGGETVGQNCKRKVGKGQSTVVAEEGTSKGGGG